MIVTDDMIMRAWREACDDDANKRFRDIVIAFARTILRLRVLR